MLDYLDIVFTEAKKEDADQGIIQNLLQQRASLEFLSNVLVDTNLGGEERKRKFQEYFDDLRLALPTFGVVSNGTNWIFTKCIGKNDASEKTSILISPKISIEYNQGGDNNDVGMLSQTIQKIVFIITNIIIEQIENTIHCQPIKKIKSIENHDPITVISSEAKEGNALLDETAKFESGEDEVTTEEDEDHCL